MTNVFGGVKEGVAEITGAAFLHLRISVGQFAGLVDGRTEARVSEDFVRKIETGEVANLGEDDGSHAIIDSGYRKKWRIPFVHDGFYLRFNFVNLVGEFLNEFERMLQLQRLGGHNKADGTFRYVADFHGFFAVIAASEGVMQEIGQAGKCDRQFARLPETRSKGRKRRQYADLEAFFPIQAVQTLLSRAGAMLMRLPAYSPDLKPIEMMRSKVKAILRKAKERTQETLIATIKEAMKKITPEDCQGWFRKAGYR